MNKLHQPVLLNEVIQGLRIDPQGIYIDATFGRGGHSEAILEQLGPQGRLYALDKDWDAIAYAKEHFAKDGRFSCTQGSFLSLKLLASDWGIAVKVSGILMDLGVSSPQLDNAERGFSFMQTGPLDMRMDRQQSLTAEMFINQSKEELLADVFFEYGEERYAKRIARAIVAARKIAAIRDTKVLAELVKEAHPKWEKHKHPATRVFQAIRIYVNRELTDLSACLEQCLDILTVGGRLAVISFHSLEDRIVKQFMQREALGDSLPKDIPIMSTKPLRLKKIGKAIKPDDLESQMNHRSRSAILRIGEKQS